MSLFMSGNIFTQNRWVGGRILLSVFRSQDSYEKYRGVSQFISFAFIKNMLSKLGRSHRFLIESYFIRSYHPIENEFLILTVNSILLI